jgi:hypothetical protein
MEQQIAVGNFFDAEDFVPVTQAHLMADGEAVGAAGVEVLEQLASASVEERTVRIPTVTDPRGVDFSACGLGQPDYAESRERRIVAALEALGCLMTDTCINYQIVTPPVLGEHIAFGDTGSSIFANSVCGARTNFEGGVAALWAALSGRVPRYGMHLGECRGATDWFHVDDVPTSPAAWGALGGIIGRQMGSYWQAPVITGIDGSPGATALKFFGAALASYGSTPLFHIVGVTPEAPTLDSVFKGTERRHTVSKKDFEAFVSGFNTDDTGVDIVVLSAPQLNLYELQEVAGLLDGQRINADVTFIMTTPPEVARSAERMGISQRIKASGAQLLEGVCFYQMYSREMGEANGWRRIVTSSAKLANILGGYGYQPRLATLEHCIDAAVNGKLKEVGL